MRVQRQETGAEAICRLSGTDMAHYTDVRDTISDLQRQEDKVLSLYLSLAACSVSAGQRTAFTAARQADSSACKADDGGNGWCGRSAHEARDVC